MTIQQHASFGSSAAELNATSKLVKAWESKNAKNAAKAGGVSLMALSLAACGGSSTPVADAPAADPVVPVVVTPDGVAYTLTSSDDSISGLGGDDTVAGTISVSSTGVVTSTLGAGDVVNGGDGADTMTLRVTTTAVTNATDAVAQVNTYTFGDQAAADTATITIGGTSYTISAGADSVTAAAVTAAINAHYGEVVAAVSGDDSNVVTVTAPTAGTALDAIVFGIGTDSLGVAPSEAIDVATVFTTANVVAVAGTAADLSNAVVVAAADVDSIESVIVHNTGGSVTLDASTYTGSTNFTAKLSTGAVTFNDIGTADITIEGNDIVANGDVTFRGSDAASVTDALVINATGGVQQGTVTSSDANDDWTNVTINSSGGTETATTMANAFTAMDLAGGNSMDVLTVNASSSISTGVISGWDTTGADANTGAIIVTGDSTVDLGALDAAVESVTASASSGGVRFTASSQTDFSFVGSAGDDRVTTNAVLSTVESDAASVDAGAGSDDRVTVAGSTHVTATVGALYKGFEQVQVSNGVAVDMDHLAANNSIDTVLLTTGGQVNDMTAAQAANITVSAGGNAPVLTVKGGTTVGQVDTVAITASDALAAVNTISLGAINIAGVEKLELTATDNVTVTALTAATSLDGITGTGAGVISITSGASLGNTNQTINLTEATGDNVVDLTAATAAVAVTTGSGSDTITLGVNVAHTVNAGGGLDIITVGGSAGADIVSTALTSADADEIVDFATTANDYDYNGALSNGTGSVSGGIAATEITTATTIAGGLAAAGAGDDIVFIASTAIAGATLDAAETMTAATLNAAEAALVAADGALGGAIANLDDVLGADDAVLFVLETDTASFVLRVTNDDRTVANTLTQDEIEMVAVFDHTATDESDSLVAADFI